MFLLTFYFKCAIIGVESEAYLMKPEYLGAFIGFNPDYVKTLSKAPKIYKVGESVDPATLPPSADSSKLIPNIIAGCYAVELDPTLVPHTPGKVVIVSQVTRTGSGFIRVRWGEPHTPGTLYAEYHFGI
jgi:hypothetical protein